MRDPLAAEPPSRRPVVLYTERLELSPFTAADADELVALFNDPDVGRWLLDGESVSRAWVEEEIAASERRFREGRCGLWALRELGGGGAHDARDTPRPRPLDRAPATGIVGFAGFRPFFEPPELQLLYGLLPGWWGRGLAREAAARVIGHARSELGLREILAATDRPNHASSRVLEKLGFVLWKGSDDGPAGTLFYRLTFPRPPGAPLR
jgi:[ribosomal protein S5]-alanine N-acetyltransferase